jgi:hypothetical protein
MCTRVHVFAPLVAAALPHDIDSFRPPHSLHSGRVFCTNMALGSYESRHIAACRGSLDIADIFASSPFVVSSHNLIPALLARILLLIFSSSYLHNSAALRTSEFTMSPPDDQPKPANEAAEALDAAAMLQPPKDRKLSLISNLQKH